MGTISIARSLPAQKKARNSLHGDPEWSRVTAGVRLQEEVVQGLLAAAKPPADAPRASGGEWPGDSKKRAFCQCSRSAASGACGALFAGL
mgnify:CR=1 FL=1